MSYLFQVNIGPVQDFIASARRTRDLYFGSWLLSYLSRTVAVQIVGKNGLDSLIFPAPEKEELDAKDSNVANKIVALIEQDPKELAECVQTRIKERVREIRDEAYKNIWLPKADLEMAYKQIDDLIEFLWVALPYDRQNQEPGYYETMRNQLEALMAARKNTRDFHAVPWKRMYVPKSSIDGQLESVIPEDRYPTRKLSSAEKQVKISELYQRFHAGPAERLSGVDLLKRHGTRLQERNTDLSKQQEQNTTAPDFEALSTSHVATLPFLKRLESIQGQGLDYVREVWDSYIKLFKEAAAFPEAVRKVPQGYVEHSILGQHDGGMLFEDQLADMLYLPAFDTTTMTRMQPVKNALRNFYQSVDKQLAAPIRPNPYYVLLQADGDSMGKVIDAHAQNGYDKHREFSKALSSFAEGVDTIIEKHEGALVYAGGDDVLAFLPLHTVLQCASRLAEQFRKELKDFADQEAKPTLSVGIAIVHHLDTLKEARKLAKQAENRAKGVDGKNALAITISKRSGESYNIAGSWETKEASQAIGDYLGKLINFCCDGIIPGGTAYELRDLAVRLN
ncbi:MAG TPA: type III-B CRISPR-associated protein Cas10/Cmr2, partial [Ktedonobacteraceae bacterium]|nr:type III-B CRISPR-associated protein Cas10/Cmr2 [Ktedonobacteraceae bacterium]